MRALILAGGSGTRFWPLSRRDRPKQLLALDGERSLLQATVDRLDPLIAATNVWVCTTERLADPVREQLDSVPSEQVLCEPEGRNTAPAIGWSLQLMAGERSDDDIVAVLPADHRFADAAAFRDALSAAADVARATDRVMTLGVAPRWPETGYGYLELGDPLDGCDLDGREALELEQFREKPDAATAETYLRSGRHLWNAGIFVFRSSTLLSALRRFEPDVASGLDALTAASSRAADVYRRIYSELPSISIDYAVMERLPAENAIAALRLDAGWSDLGSWQALSDELSTGDCETGDSNIGGNQTHGDVIAVESDDNLLWADEGTVAVAGVSGLVVVRTGDSVLVVPKEKSQDVKKIVEELKRQNRADRL